MRNNFSRFFNDDDVADANPQSVYDVDVVEACARNDRPGDLRGLKLRDGSDDARLSDLNDNVADARRRFVLFEFARDDPFRVFCRRADFFTRREVVDF